MLHCNSLLGGPARVVLAVVAWKEPWYNNEDCDKSERHAQKDNKVVGFEHKLRARGKW